MSPLETPIVVLSGAGLSAPSGVPTFRDANGLWEGHRVEDVATPLAWWRNAELVRQFYDERRIACAAVRPNAGHVALAKAQERLGVKQLRLITQNIDGLLTRAGAADVIEMHGSLWKLQCEDDRGHAWHDVAGAQDPDACCACGGHLRPAVVWFGEVPLEMDAIFHAVRTCRTFVSVGTSGLVHPAAGLVDIARRAGARCVEVNPRRTGGPFHEVIEASADVALPAIFEEPQLLP